MKFQKSCRCVRVSESEHGSRGAKEKREMHRICSEIILRSVVLGRAHSVAVIRRVDPDGWTFDLIQSIIFNLVPVKAALSK